MAKLNNIETFKVTSMDSYFFDNNIWVFLFAPIANSNPEKQKIYSSFLSSIKTANATIFTTSLVISEFANFCLRLSFKQWKEKTRNYDADYKKDYMITQDYKDSSADVKDNIKAILKITEKRPDDYNSIDLDAILDNISIIDFNDLYYAELCLKNRLKIVTDDKDFTKINSSVEVISLIKS